MIRVLSLAAASMHRQSIRLRSTRHLADRLIPSLIQICIIRHNGNAIIKSGTLIGSLIESLIASLIESRYLSTNEIIIVFDKE